MLDGAAMRDVSRWGLQHPAWVTAIERMLSPSRAAALCECFVCDTSVMAFAHFVSRSVDNFSEAREGTRLKALKRMLEARRDAFQRIFYF